MTTFPERRHHDAESSGETLTLTLGGVEYTRDSTLTIRAGLKLTEIREEIRLAAIANEAAQKAGKPPPDRIAVQDRDEVWFLLDMVGDDMRTQMEANKVTWADMQHAGLTIMTWHMAGPEAARACWLGEEATPLPPAKSASTRTAGSSTRAPKKPRSTGQTSSARGRSSKPTSRGSTKST